MHLNQLRYFITLASCQSFTQAAERHHLTQTAITLQIKALEDSLGFKLGNMSDQICLIDLEIFTELVPVFCSHVYVKILINWQKNFYQTNWILFFHGIVPI